MLFIINVTPDRSFIRRKHPRSSGAIHYIYIEEFQLVVLLVLKLLSTSCTQLYILTGGGLPFHSRTQVQQVLSYIMSVPEILLLWGIIGHSALNKFGMQESIHTLKIEQQLAFTVSVAVVLRYLLSLYIIYIII